MLEGLWGELVFIEGEQLQVVVAHIVIDIVVNIIVIVDIDRIS